MCVMNYVADSEFYLRLRKFILKKKKKEESFTSDWENTKEKVRERGRESEGEREREGREKEETDRQTELIRKPEFTTRLSWRQRPR